MCYFPSNLLFILLHPFDLQSGSLSFFLEFAYDKKSLGAVFHPNNCNKFELIILHWNI